MKNKITTQSVGFSEYSQYFRINPSTGEINFFNINKEIDFDLYFKVGNGAIDYTSGVPLMKVQYSSPYFIKPNISPFFNGTLVPLLIDL